MRTPSARLRGAAIVTLVASACSLDDLADGNPGSGANGTTASTSDATTSSTVTTGGFGGTGGMEPSMFTWAEALPDAGDQRADERWRPSVAPYKDGFVVVLNAAGDTENDVRTIIRAYQPKAAGPGYEVAWQNVLVEHAPGVVDGNFRRRRALAVGGIGGNRVVVAGTYWEHLELDGVPLFDDIMNQAGFYVVLEESSPGDDAAQVVEQGRTKQSSYINAVAYDGMGRLFLGGATNANGLVDASTFTCAGMPALTVNDVAFVVTQPNDAACRGVVFSPIGGSGSRSSQGVHALERRGGRVFASGVFAPPEDGANSTTTFAPGKTLVRTGTSGSDLFVANLDADTLAVQWVRGFGRAGVSETMVDYLVDAEGTSWIAGTGGTVGCTCDGMACPNNSTNFIVSLVQGGCTEALRLDPSLANDPPFRSISRFDDGADRHLWVAGDLTIPNPVCDPTSLQPMTRSGFLVDLALGAERLVPQTGLQVGNTLPISFARALRLSNGAPLLVGSFANQFDPALPTPAVGNGSDFFVGELAGPLPTQCTPP